MSTGQFPGGKPGISLDDVRLLFLTCCLPLTAAVGCGGNAFSAGSGGDGGTTGVEAGSDGQGSEAGPPQDAGSTSWCGTRTERFCEDFDEYRSVNDFLGSSKWTTFQQSMGAFHLDTQNALSPPNALHVTGSDHAQVLAVKTSDTLPSPVQTLTLAFDLRVNAPPPNVGFLSLAGLAAFSFGDTIDRDVVALAVANGTPPVLQAAWLASADAGASDAGTYAIANLTGPFPQSDSWSARYSLVIDYSHGGGGCLQIYAGTASQLAQCLQLPDSFGSPKSVSIAIGDYSALLGNTGLVDVEFDNVTFDAR
jgi:hypothetical protein